MFADPAFEKGNPVDWLATMTVPHDVLNAAIAQDEPDSIVDDNHVLLRGPRSHLEMNVLYAVCRAEQIGLDIPIDGTAIISYCLACLPTSRGSISLSSKDPLDHPIIDPNYAGTKADRFVMQEGWRVMSRLMLETPEGKDLVVDEIVPDGYICLLSNASSDDIDTRINIGAVSCYHPAGSCSMGKVVDSSCKLHGVEGHKLRQLFLLI